MILTKRDQHVHAMRTTAGKKFKHLLWSCFLIIVQNVNMVTDGKRNSRLNPVRCTNFSSPHYCNRYFSNEWCTQSIAVMGHAIATVGTLTDRTCKKFSS